MLRWVNHNNGVITMNDQMLNLEEWYEEVEPNEEIREKAGELNALTTTYITFS